MTPEPAFVDVAGRKIQITSGGTGPPLVFLHSAVGEAWWAEWCDLLAADYTVHLPFHPGFEESEGYEDIDDIEDLAFHYDDLFAALGADRPVLVGQSLGGWIAAEYAVRWPEKLSALVLVDAAGLRSPEQPPVDMWAVRPPELADLLFADTSHPLYAMLQAFQADQPPPAEVLIPFFKAMQSTARVAWNPYLHNPKLAGRLHRIACPTLVVWGDRDGLIPPVHGRMYADAIPGARLETLPDTGHLPLVERAQSAARLVADFLRTR